VAEGQQRSRGLEFGLNGNLTEALAISSSLAFTKARLEGIQRSEYMGHQAQNTPKVRFASYLSYAVPAVEGLRVLGGGRYSASKFANKEGSARVSGFSVFDLGAAYQFNLDQKTAVLRLNIDNLFNKKYWRDVGESGGDNYMFLGSPRTASLALNVNF